MKKLIYTLALGLFSCLFVACSDDDPSKNSIFDTTPPVRNALDKWLLSTFTKTYNVELKYKMEDIEADPNYTLVPAQYEKSIALAKLTKFLWFEAYDTVAGVPFTRENAPRIIFFIGSPAYNSNGTTTEGTAEGGLKVTLYSVNRLDVQNLDIDFLNDRYFHTMHHEFTHILTQRKNYDAGFQLISEKDYVSGSWSDKENSETSLAKGFITPYARSEYNEDFAELLSTYVTSSQADWDATLAAAGATGKGTIERKFNIVKKYLKDSWKIDIEVLRDEVLDRSSRVDTLDLENI